MVVLYMDHSTSSTIENCEFNGNVAGLNGGAIDWLAGSENGKVIKSTFTNNTAKRSGGAIHWSGHYGTISASNFTDNKATGEVINEINGVTGGGDGGAVLWVGSHGIIKITVTLLITLQNTVVEQYLFMVTQLKIVPTQQ